MGFLLDSDKQSFRLDHVKNISKSRLLLSKYKIKVFIWYILNENMSQLGDYDRSFHIGCSMWNNYLSFRKK